MIQNKGINFNQNGVKEQNASPSKGDIFRPLRRTTPSPGSSPNKAAVPVTHYSPQPSTPRKENHPPPPQRPIPATPTPPSTPPSASRGGGGGGTPQAAVPRPALNPTTSPTQNVYNNSIILLTAITATTTPPRISPIPTTPPSSPAPPPQQNNINNNAKNTSSPLLAVARAGQVPSSPRHLSVPPVATSSRKCIVLSMRTFWARLSTFNDWKRTRPTPQNLALSGFYFSGNIKKQKPGDMDKTTCFSCGLTFVNWKPSDDPWTMHVKYNRVNKKNCSFVARRPKNMSLIEYNKGNDLQGIAIELEMMEIEALTAGKGNHTHPLDIKAKLDYFVFVNSNIFIQRQDLLHHTEELASFLVRLATSESEATSTPKSPRRKNQAKKARAMNGISSPRPRSITDVDSRSRDLEKERERQREEEKNNEIKRLRELEVAKLRRKAEEEKERDREREREKEILQEIEYQKQKQQEREQQKQQLLQKDRIQEDRTFFTTPAPVPMSPLKEKRMSLDSLFKRKITRGSPLSPVRLLNRGKENGKTKTKEKEDRDAEKEEQYKETKPKLEKGKEKVPLDENEYALTDTSEFSGDYMQEMIFTAELSEESPSIETMINAAETDSGASVNKSDLYLGLREYVTENLLQIRGETDDSESNESDSEESSSSAGTSDSSASGSSNSQYRGRRSTIGNLPTDYREIDFAELILQERVGYGSFATVWKGTWRGGSVAVKILREVDLFNRKVVEEFRREAATMHHVGNHPNIVKFIGVCSKSSTNLCLISEYCCYGSLQSMLRGDKALPSIAHKVLVGIARDAAAGIVHLHCERVIHRDIAARNIMVGHNYVAQVGDFGFSRIKQKDASHGITGTIGPIKHMAPEAILSRIYSEKSDSFSFGCLLWEMVAKKEPYEEVKSLLEVGMLVIKGLRLTIPDGSCTVFSDLMKQCWSAEPGQRPDFKTIHSTLQRYYDIL